MNNFHLAEAPLVAIHNGVPTTSSLQIAQKFDKLHKDVLRAIASLDCSTKFKERNFAPSFYIREIDGRGQHKYPLYYITRDGFAFLVMGFTGKVAAQFKEEYITAFNQMEAYIQSRKIDESVIMAQLEKNCNELTVKLKSAISQLGKESGVNIGLSELPNAVSVWRNYSLSENIDYLFSAITGGLLTGWWALFESAKSRAEIEAMRETLSEFVCKAHQRHRIFPR